VLKRGFQHIVELCSIKTKRKKGEGVMDEEIEKIIIEGACEIMGARPNFNDRRAKSRVLKFSTVIRTADGKLESKLWRYPILKRLEKIPGVKVDLFKAEFFSYYRKYPAARVRIIY
jgi:hypothetical protein